VANDDGWRTPIRHPKANAGSPNPAFWCFGNLVPETNLTNEVLLGYGTLPQKIPPCFAKSFIFVEEETPTFLQA